MYQKIRLHNHFKSFQALMAMEQSFEAIILPDQISLRINATSILNTDTLLWQSRNSPGARKVKEFD